MPSLRVIICNKKGLHARATAKFVKTVEHFRSDVQVKRVEPLPGQDADEHMGPVSGRSLLGLMMLGADTGTQLEIIAEGADAQAVLASLGELVAQRFGEEE